MDFFWSRNNNWQEKTADHCIWDQAEKSRPYVNSSSATILTNVEMIALLFNGNEDQVREFANALNNLHHTLTSSPTKEYDEKKKN